jgi:ABC-type transport system involved in multi-copper enzyme maturation permease subunit
MVVIILGIGALATWLTTRNWATTGLVDRLTFDPTNRSLTGILFGQLAIGILGILIMSAEYGTGTIRATLAAVPNRPLVLAAKSLVFGVVAVVVGEATAFAAFLIGQSLLVSPTPHATLSEPGVLTAVAGSGLYLAVLGLLALGIATIVRHTAGSIAVFVGLLLVLPLIVQALPTSIRIHVSRYLPATIGYVMSSTNLHGFDAPIFSAWTGLLLLCGYAAAALVVGCVLLVRRDA